MLGLHFAWAALLWYCDENSCNERGSTRKAKLRSTSRAAQYSILQTVRIRFLFKHFFEFLIITNTIVLQGSFDK